MSLTAFETKIPDKHPLHWVDPPSTIAISLVFLQRKRLSSTDTSRNEAPTKTSSRPSPAVFSTKPTKTEPQPQRIDTTLDPTQTRLSTTR